MGISFGPIRKVDFLWVNVRNIYIYECFPKIWLPQNGWFIMVPNPIKIHDLGVPLFLETPIYITQGSNEHLSFHP